MNEYLVYSFEIKNWEGIWETGIVLQENEQWILLANITADYFIDGYKLIVKKHIAHKFREEDEKTYEKYFKLKNIPVPSLPKNFQFQNTVLDALSWVQENYSFFEFKDYDEYENFTGKLKNINLDEGTFFIDYLFNDGTIDTEYEVEFYADQVTTISFNTYYLQAITFLYQENLKGKPAETFETKRKKVNRK